jgi:hypothetical protein
MSDDLVYDICGVCGKKTEISFRRREHGEKSFCPDCNRIQAKKDGYQEGDKCGHPTGTPQ